MAPNARSTASSSAARTGTSSRRGAVLLALVCLLVGAVIGGLVATAAGGGDGAPEPGSIEAVAAELADGQQQEATALAQELAGAAEIAHGRAGDVLAGLAVLAPTDDGAAAAGDPADADGEAAADAAGGTTADAAAWADELEQARSALEATGEGADDHGVTRAALLGSLDLLGNAVETAGTLPADGTDRGAAVARVARDRDAAVRLWQAGAARLDTLVVAAGGEHIHLFLAPDGDPDAVPEEFREPRGDG